MALINPVLFGGSAPTTGDYLVRFIDFDGTILKEQWVNAGQAATAPTPPTHQYLTFDEWNNDFTNIQHDLDVGATYYTTDGKTYLFMRYTNTTGLQPAILLNKATTAQMNIDWGDGTGASLSGSGNITITKAAPYAAIGDYTITIECSGNYSFSANMLNNNANYYSCLLKCYFSSKVTSLGFTSLSNSFSLSYCMIPKSVTSFNQYSFYDCRSLIALVIPKSITTLINSYQIFYQCYSLRNCVLPPISALSSDDQTFVSCTSLENIIITNLSGKLYSWTFRNCFSLRKVIIRGNITEILNEAFYMCNSLAYLDFPDTVVTLAVRSFNGCFSLKNFIINYKISAINTGQTFLDNRTTLKYEVLPVNPPSIAANTFTGINLACKIYVPDASVSAYQAATNWVTYANYIYPISQLAEYAGTIFFQSNGGNAIKQIKGTVGAVATEPTAPTKTGFTFAGWYKEAALTNAWNWASDIYPATNITLYAKWV